MGSQIITELSRIGLFAQVPLPALERLSEVTQVKTFEEGELILLEGDEGAPLFFIAEGTARIFHTNPDGREQTLIYLHAGTAFNLPSAFSETRAAPASAMSIGQMQLLVVSPADFRRITAETPEIALAVLKDFADKLYHFNRLTHDLSLRSVRGRLAGLLLAQAQSEDKPLTRWTQEEIAAQIGTVREVVSRTLRAFVKEGLIQMERQRIIVIDPEGLQNEADL